MTEIIARRQFAPLYIWLDLTFLCLLFLLLLTRKKYMTIAVGFTMGIVYMVMDYGIFHLICHSRSIPEGYSLFWVLLWILSIGILVQFGWEAGLLLGGIRSAGFATTDEKLLTLTVNSLLETNLGMPYVYWIFAALTGKWTETLRLREDRCTVTERIAENNRQKVRTFRAAVRSVYPQKSPFAPVTPECKMFVYFVHCFSACPDV